MTVTTDKPTALLDWHAFVNCPHCSSQVDLSDIDSDCDNKLAKAVFTNNWTRCCGMEFECPDCGKEFEISGLEY